MHKDASHRRRHRVKLVVRACGRRGRGDRSLDLTSTAFCRRARSRWRRGSFQSRRRGLLLAGLKAASTARRRWPRGRLERNDIGGLIEAGIAPGQRPATVRREAVSDGDVVPTCTQHHLDRLSTDRLDVHTALPSICRGKALLGQAAAGQKSSTVRVESSSTQVSIRRCASRESRLWMGFEGTTTTP